MAQTQEQETIQDLVKRAAENKVPPANTVDFLSRNLEKYADPKWLKQSREKGVPDPQIADYLFRNPDTKLKVEAAPPISADQELSMAYGLAKKYPPTPKQQEEQRHFETLAHITRQEFDRIGPITKQISDLDYQLSLGSEQSYQRYAGFLKQSTGMDLPKMSAASKLLEERRKKFEKDMTPIAFNDSDVGIHGATRLSADESALMYPGEANFLRTLGMTGTAAGLVAMPVRTAAFYALGALVNSDKEFQGHVVSLPPFASEAKGLPTSDYQALVKSPAEAVALANRVWNLNQPGAKKEAANLPPVDFKGLTLIKKPSRYDDEHTVDYVEGVPYIGKLYGKQSPVAMAETFANSIATLGSESQTPGTMIERNLGKEGSGIGFASDMVLFFGLANTGGIWGGKKLPTFLQAMQAAKKNVVAGLQKISGEAATIADVEKLVPKLMEEASGGINQGELAGIIDKNLKLGSVEDIYLKQTMNGIADLIENPGKLPTPPKLGPANVEIESRGPDLGVFANGLGTPINQITSKFGDLAEIATRKVVMAEYWMRGKFEKAFGVVEGIVDDLKGTSFDPSKNTRFFDLIEADEIPKNLDPKVGGALNKYKTFMQQYLDKIVEMKVKRGDLKVVYGVEGPPNAASGFFHDTIEAAQKELADAGGNGTIQKSILSRLQADKFSLKGPTGEPIPGRYVLPTELRNQKYGISNYIHHMFKGSLRIYGPDDAIVGMVNTEGEALAKIHEFRTANPSLAEGKFRVVPNIQFRDHFAMLARKARLSLLEKIGDDFGLSKTEVEKYYAEEMALKPSKSFLQARQGFEGYSKEFEPVSKVYAMSVERWLATEGIRADIEKSIAAIEQKQPAVANRIRFAMRRLEGAPDEASGLVDNTIRGWFGDSFQPGALERFADRFTAATSAGMLTTLRFHIQNFFQPAQQLLWVSNPVRLAKAYAMAASKEGKAFLDNIGFYSGGGKFGFTPSLSRPIETIKRVFSAVENQNQRASFFDRYFAAKEQGWSEAKAIENGVLAGQVQTQFLSLTTNRPKFASSAAGKILFQFKPWTTQDAEFLMNLWRDNKYGRFAGSVATRMVVGGAKAVLPYKVYSAIKEKYGDDVADYARYGMFNALKWDMSGSFDFNYIPYGNSFKEKVANFVLGPGASTVTNIAGDIISDYRSPHPVKEITQDVAERIPALKIMSRAAYWIAGKKEDGTYYDLKDSKGYIDHSLDLDDIVKGIVGVTGTDVANVKETLRHSFQMDRKAVEEATVIGKWYATAIKEENEEMFDKATNMLNSWNEVNGDIRFLSSQEVSAATKGFFRGEEFDKLKRGLLNKNNKMRGFLFQETQGKQK